MKLDENVIDIIIDDIIGEINEREFRKFLRKLDLVIKPGDSSQGTLVENK